jgi:hypothetical protein
MNSSTNERLSHPEREWWDFEERGQKVGRLLARRGCASTHLRRGGGCGRSEAEQSPVPLVAVSQQLRLEVCAAGVVRAPVERPQRGLAGSFRMRRWPG